MHNIIQAIVQIYQSIPVDVWALAGGSIGVAYLSRLLKHLFGVNSRKVIITLVSTLSFIGPVLQFIIASQGNSIFAVIPHAAEIFAGATILYNVLIKDGRFDQLLLKIEAVQNTEDAKADGIIIEPSPVAALSPIQNTNNTVDF